MLPLGGTTENSENMGALTGSDLVPHHLEGVYFLLGGCFGKLLNKARQ